MPRIKIELPESFPFVTGLAVRITDVNYGGHLGNDALLSLMHEARARFLRSLGYREQDVAGAGIIMSDCAIVYQAESFWGDKLTFELTAGDFSRAGCDILYRITNTANGAAVARAKTGIVFFDYQRRTVLPVPEEFRRRFAPKG